MLTVELEYCLPDEAADNLSWSLDLEGEEEAAYLKAVAEGRDLNRCEELQPILQRALSEIRPYEAQNARDMGLDEDLGEGWEENIAVSFAVED